MVIYCTATNVRSLLTGVTTTVMDDTAVGLHITRAENIINGKIGAKYTVPFTAGSIPPLIQTICEDIAAYYVMRTLFTEDSENVNEWTKLFKEHSKTLDLIRKGDVVVLDSAGIEVTRRTTIVQSSMENYHPTFDVDHPEDWTQDTDKINEVSDTREGDS